MKRYFLGLGARRKGAFRQLFTRGTRRDARALEAELAHHYGGERAILFKNGRSALTAALKAYLEPGDGVIVNGFTCYAVIEAVKAAGMTPVYADINRGTLNYDERTLDKIKDSGAKGIIVQNTLGIPIDIKDVEDFARKHNLIIIEDLAHSVGIKYPDGREAGTVGAATVLSFGKDKAIDAISGGAVVLRDPCKNAIQAPTKLPKLSDYLRERWYPTLVVISRGLARVRLSGVWMRFLLAVHLVEKSADNRLDLERQMPKFEAKLALRQLKQGVSGVDREFCLVRDREKVLRELQGAGYYFVGFWYEKPVSPVRYYKKAHFPEAECPVATEVAAKIINIPTYYPERDLAAARKIIAKYKEEQ